MLAEGLGFATLPFARVAEDHFKSGSGVGLLCESPQSWHFYAQVFR